VNEEMRRPNEQTKIENAVFSNVRTKVVWDFFTQCLGYKRGNAKPIPAEKVVLFWGVKSCGFLDAYRHGRRCVFYLYRRHDKSIKLQIILTVFQNHVRC
jgi:hypothetical protein